MPKASRLPKHRGGNVAPAKLASKAEEKIAPTEPAKPIKLSTVADNKKDESLSRGQRKRQAKRDQYMRREQMVMAALKLKREDEQKKRIDGLDAIRDALLASVANDTNQRKDAEDAELPKDNMLKSNKSRQRLLQQETSQMNLVLQHPSFNADPLGTLKEHLKNTLANEVKQQQREAVKHAKDKVTKQAEKIALKKESGAKRSKKKFKATRSKAR